MNRKILMTLLIVILFTLSSFAQKQSKNLLENVEVKFTLQGDPTPHDVGFDNPKSNWKVKYELYVTDFSELVKLGICTIDTSNRHICPIIKDRKLNSKIKKKSLKISKGGFAKKTLLAENNREITIPINLQPNIIEIFNQAGKIPEKNPTFILFVSEKISVMNSTNAKLKEKYSATGINQLKMADSNKNFQYWNVENISLNITISKQEDGKLKLVGGLVH